MCLFDIRRDQGGDERYASGIGAGGLAYAEWNWQYVMSVDTRKLQGNTSSLCGGAQQFTERHQKFLYSLRNTPVIFQVINVYHFTVSWMCCSGASAH